MDIILFNFRLVDTAIDRMTSAQEEMLTFVSMTAVPF